MARVNSGNTHGANALKIRQQERYEEQKAAKRQVRTLPIDEAKHVRNLYTSMLLSVIIVVVCMSVLLLKAEFSVSRSMELVYEKENQLNDLKETNQNIEGSIIENLDYTKIYERALAMGMHLPSPEQVSWIEPEPTSYTEQYIVIEPQIKGEQKSASFASFMFMGW